MSVTNIHAAKTNLSKLIDAALRGEEVIIAKSGKPIVKLIAVEPPKLAIDRKKFFGALKGQFGFDWDEWKRMDREIERLFNEGQIFPERSSQ
ncbi:MAG: type II toxin-antitoxin system prevent-host-death family antitoxin [Methylocystis sp.]|nr:type II toxin-antitoxin system prevent-host-death family antitoxin [Methylocystis sp.]